MNDTTVLPLFTWHVGTMNDAVFIIDKPPYPALDDTGPYFFISGPRPVSKAIDETTANLIVAAHNLVVKELRHLIAALRAELKDVAQDRDYWKHAADEIKTQSNEIAACGFAVVPIDDDEAMIDSIEIIGDNEN